MKANLVSIIMPAYNSEKYISESIESVLAQTFSNWELIIVDDGSTDKTATIVKQYTEKDLRIKYIYQTNGKQGKARNNGIKNSNGEYVAFIDSDDLWIPEKLTIQVEALKGNNADILVSDGQIFINQPENIQGSLNSLKGFYQGEGALLLFLKENKIPILSAITYRAKIMKVGGFEESLIAQNIEDYQLWIKLILDGCSICGIPQKLVYYRKHDLQMTNYDPIFYSRIFWMLDSFINIPQKLTIEFDKAKLYWFYAWFSNRANNNEEAKKIIKSSNNIPALKSINKIIHVLLSIFGLRMSKIFLRISVKAILLFK